MNPTAIFLKKLKDNSRLTLKNLADSTGLTQAFLSMILKGKRNVTENTLEKILKCGFRWKKEAIYDQLQELNFRTTNLRLSKTYPSMAAEELREHEKQMLFKKYRVLVSVVHFNDYFHPCIRFEITGQRRFAYFVIRFTAINEQYPRILISQEKPEVVGVIEGKGSRQIENISPLELGHLFEDDAEKIFACFLDELKKHSEKAPSDINRNALKQAIVELTAYLAVHVYGPKKKLKEFSFSQ